MRRMPDNVRTAGRIAAVVGGLLTLFAMAMIFSYAAEPNAVKPAPGASAGPIADALFSHFLIVLVVYAAVAALMMGAGLELSQGKEGGRRALMIALSAAIVFVVGIAVTMASGFFAMPAPPPEATELLAGVSGRAFRGVVVAGGIVVTAMMLGIGGVLFVAIRWLNSAPVRAACRPGEADP